MMTNWATPASQNRSNQSVSQRTAPSTASAAMIPRQTQNSGRGPRRARASSVASHAKAVILALLLLWPGSAYSQTYTLLPAPYLTVMNNTSGAIVSGSCVWTYLAGGTTPVTTYTTSTGTANSNPVIADAAGRVVIYAQPGVSYKLVIEAPCVPPAHGAVLKTADNIGAVPTSASAVDVTVTAGEGLVAGDVVYLSDGSGGLNSGQWYKADADFTYASSTSVAVGIATAAITSGSTGSVRMTGRVTGLSGLSVGELYYVSATAGAMTATPPANAWFLGKADSATSLLLGSATGSIRLPDSDGTHSLVVTTTSNLTADRLLTIVPGDAARTLTLSADAALNQNLLTTSSPAFATLVTSTASDTAAVGQFFANQGSTGDAGIRMSVGAQDWFLCVDNSDSDAFKISATTGCGSSVWMKINHQSAGLTYMQGVYDNTNGGAANVVVLSDGNILRSTSSARYKRNVLPFADWRWLLKLQPQVSERTDDKPGRQYVSFIAEDVAAIGPKDLLGNPLFANLDTQGRPDDVAYPHFVIPLTAAVQEHEATIQSLQQAIAALQARIAALEAK